MINALPSQPVSLSYLRHELRTPINAILGYSEMLLEDLQDGGDRESISTLKKIHTCGQQLLLLINNALAEETTLPDPEDKSRQDDLEDNLRTRFSETDRLELTVFWDAILSYCDWLDHNAEDTLKPDTEKIRDAASQLLDLINTLLQEVPQSTIQRPPSANPSQSVLPLSTSSQTIDIEPDIFPAVSISERSGHLLVVDDNENNRELLSRQLIRQGHQVETAINGEQAITKVVNCNYDVILLDILMPGLNGYDVLEKLMQHRDWRSIPVIMISALDELDSVVRCIDRGAADYLTKPFNPVILKARINACLEKKHLHDLEVSHLDQLAAANAQMSRYLREVDRITAAAAAVEANTFHPTILELVAARTDELGRLARVFTHTVQTMKTREQDLRIAEEQYRSIFENALEGIFQSSPDGRFISVNPAMAKIHRYSSPDEMMVPVDKLAKRIYVDQNRRDDFIKAINQQGTVKDFEYRSYCKDGSIIWTQVDARAVRDKHNEILYYEGIVQDITQRVYREDQLRRQLKELQIEINQEQRQEEVVSLTSSNYFQEVQKEVAAINLENFWN